MNSKYGVHFVVLVLIYLFVSCTGKSGLSTKVDEYMTRMAARGFSGAILVAKDGEVILSQGYGMANREQQIPITARTVFTIGSITKQFTGAAILRLQMQGKVRVSDAITRYFDDVPEDKQGITLHHLLTHTAGFPGAIGDDFERNTRQEFIEQAMNTELLHSPGERYEYSNVGFSILGAIIEQVSGQPYEQYLNENLFTPAGMTNTGYVLPEWRDSDLAHGYRGDSDWGTIKDRPWDEDGPYWHLRANGGILSTVGDMYKWHLALQGDGILSEEAKEAYYRPHVPEGEGADTYYGYGWSVATTPRGTRLIAHNGGNGIFSADFLRYIDEDVVIVVLANTSGQSAWEVSSVVARIVFGYEYELPSEGIETLTEEELRQSPWGERALALLEIYSEDDTTRMRQFVTEHFAPEFIERVSIDRLVDFIRTDQEGIGQSAIGRIEKPSENTLELTVRSKRSGEWWLIKLTFEKDAPHRIKEAGVMGTEPPRG